MRQTTERARPVNARNVSDRRCCLTRSFEKRLAARCTARLGPLALAFCVGVVAALGGCGTRTSLDTPITSSSVPPGCLSSIACQAGERCEAGRCVPERTCAAAEPPTLIATLDHAADFAWAIRYSGRDVLEEPIDASVESGMLRATTTRFTELATGRHVDWRYDDGARGCSDDLAWCAAGLTTFNIYPSPSLDFARGTFAPGKNVALPQGANWFGDDSFGGRGRWIVAVDAGLGKASLSYFDPATRSQTSLLPAAAVWMPAVLPLGGHGARFFALEQDSAGSSRWVLSVGEAHADGSPSSWTEVARPPEFPDQNQRLLPAFVGEELRFARVDQTANRFHVFRIGLSGLEEIGVLDPGIEASSVANLERAGDGFAAPVDAIYRFVECSPTECVALRLDLASVQASIVGRVPVSFRRPSILASRWLGCDRAELLVGDVRSDGTTAIVRLRLGPGS
jgi:hypothetical protein